MERVRELIASSSEPGGERQLWKNYAGGSVEYEMVINGVFIMATYNGLSSELLVRHAVDKAARGGARALIGGLGMGYSVKEACEYARPLRAIDVVELEPTVIHWNRTLLHDLNGKYLLDSRVRLIEGDFVRYVSGCREKYDAICMDIDNGPMMLVNSENASAYSYQFFYDVSDALSADGVFAIWSCNEDDSLLRRMSEVFLDCHVEEIPESFMGKALNSYVYYGYRTQ